MKPILRIRRPGAAALLLAWALVPASAPAADPVGAVAQEPLRDPWVPPAARLPSNRTPTRGAALQAQVEAKLRRAFDAADVRHAGRLTRAQAQSGGLGFVAAHFEEIDQRREGAVGFEDVRRFLAARGAKPD